MRIFNKKPSSKEIADIEAQRVLRDKIAVRLAAAERAVAEHHATIRQLAIGNAEDEALDAAESGMRAALDRARTLGDALDDADARIREAERRRDTAEDQKRRAETAAEIDGVTDTLVAAGIQFDAVIEMMAKVTERANAITRDASGLYGFALRAKSELPESIAMLAGQLRNIATATRSGSAPASLPQPEPQPQPTRHVPPPATMRVFAVKPIKWIDATGDLRIHPEFFDIDLPPDIAARAIELDAAVPLDHPRRRQMHGHGPVYRPDPDRCTSLIPGDDAQPKPRPELVPGVPIEPLQEQRATYAVPAFGA